MAAKDGEGPVVDHETKSTEEKSPAYVPGPDAVDITPDKDGGVLKEIKRPGSGDESPLAGDKVFVHYVGTLIDGTKFDSSRDRGEQFEFNLGKRNVIKAWDLGVATMKRGELAVLQCKSEYAYEKKGSPPKIPPNATLVFEVELIDWKGEDISEDKDEGVLKSLLKEGEGYETPNDGAVCEIHLVGSYNGKVFEDRDVKFTVGEGYEMGVVEGVEMAVQKLKKLEEAKLKVKAKYGYGAVGNARYNIPKGADLEYIVTLKQFEKAKESWQMDTAEKLEQSEIMKSKGTDYFKRDKYHLAHRYYKKIVDYLEHESSLKEEEAERRKKLLLAANLNLAMCALKLRDDAEALNFCTKALELEPKNEKGLFRRGMANLNLQNFEESVVDFRTVLEIDPQNKAARNQIIIANQKLKKIREKERAMFGGMFAKFAEEDAKKEKLAKQNEPENIEKENNDATTNEKEENKADIKETTQQEVKAN